MWRRHSRPTRRARSGPRTRRTRRTATRSRTCGRPAMRASSDMPRRALPPTSSSSTWWPRRSAARRRRRKRWSGHKSARSATTWSDTRRRFASEHRDSSQGSSRPGRRLVVAADSLVCADDGPHRSPSVLSDPAPAFSRMLEKLQNNRNALGVIFMLPAALLLLLFLTYPLGLGSWVGLENYEYLWGDSVTRLALFNTLFYTGVASVLKFFLGLWLALLLNRNIRFKTFFRAVILLPYIVPTALSAIAFW